MKNLVLLLTVLLSTTYAFAQKNSEKYEFPKETREFLKVAFPGINTMFIIDESKIESGKKYRKDRYLTSYTGANGKSFVDEAQMDEGDDILVYNKKPWFNATKQQLIMLENSAGSQQAKNGRVRDGQGLERIMTVGNLLMNVGGQVMNRIDQRRNGGTYYGDYSSGSSSSGVQTVNMRY